MQHPISSYSLALPTNKEYIIIFRYNKQTKKALGLEKEYIKRGRTCDEERGEFFNNKNNS